MRSIAVAILLLAGCLAAPGAVRAETVRAGYTSRDLNYLPFFIAQKYFHPKEGLQVELVSIGRSDVQLQALVTGDLHFANINADGIIIWNERSGSGCLERCASTFCATVPSPHGGLPVSRKYSVAPRP